MVISCVKIHIRHHTYLLRWRIAIGTYNYEINLVTAAIVKTKPSFAKSRSVNAKLLTATFQEAKTNVATTEPNSI